MEHRIHTLSWRPVCCKFYNGLFRSQGNSMDTAYTDKSYTAGYGRTVSCCMADSGNSSWNWQYHYTEYIYIRCCCNTDAFYHWQEAEHKKSYTGIHHIYRRVLSFRRNCKCNLLQYGCRLYDRKERLRNNIFTDSHNYFKKYYCCRDVYGKGI